MSCSLNKEWTNFSLFNSSNSKPQLYLVIYHQRYALYYVSLQKRRILDRIVFSWKTSCVNLTFFWIVLLLMANPRGWPKVKVRLVFTSRYRAHNRRICVFSLFLCSYLVTCCRKQSFSLICYKFDFLESYILVCSVSVYVVF